MAGFRMHITVSTLCGLTYGGALVNPGGLTAESAVLAAGITAVGGMLPDLDSDSGVPVREMSGVAAAVVPLLLYPRLMAPGAGLSQEGALAALGVLYFVIRYGGANLLKYVSVHRGMFHSIPGMVIAGLVVYLEYHSDNVRIRLALGCGAMIGFLSHLILDEIYSVDFNGVRLRLNKFAGSAVKFISPSWLGTSICYGILFGLGFLAYMDSLQYLNDPKKPVIPGFSLSTALKAP